MDLGKFFSLKDFFNYYVAGVVWTIDFAIMATWLGKPSNLGTAVSSLQGLPEFIVVGIMAIVLPYVIGFALSPLCYVVAKWWRKRRVDPIDWAVYYPKYITSKYKQSNESIVERFGGRRLQEVMARQVLQLACGKFGFKVITEKAISGLWFYEIQAYIVNKGGAVVDLAIRARDLSNLTESLLIPVPLFFALLTAQLIPLPDVLLLLIGVAIFVLVLVLLAKRYYDLREYWVKHVYRTFVILNLDQPDSSSNDD
jgi:hypothetical protein